MKVILLSDVHGSGKAGDIVDVSDGYARNMLIPRKIAVEATPQNVNRLEREKAQIEARRAEEKAAAEELKKKLETLTIRIEAKAGENGKVFGSITSMDIVNAVKTQFDIELDKKKIQMPAPIKTTGAASVEVKLYPEVSGKLNLMIVAE